MFAKHEYVKILKGARITTTDPARSPSYINTKNWKVYVVKVDGDGVWWSCQKRWLYCCAASWVEKTEVPYD